MQSCVHSFFFFFCPTDWPTFTRGEGDGKRNILWGWHKSYTRSTDFIFVNIDFRDTRRYPLPGPTNLIFSRFKEDWNAFSWLDCKTVGFFSKSVKKLVKAWRTSLTRAKLVGRVSPQSRSLFSASFQTFFSTTGAYLNTQQSGLFCSLPHDGLFPTIWSLNFYHVILYFSKTPLAARTVERTCWASIRYFHYIPRLFLEDSSLKDDL